MSFFCLNDVEMILENRSLEKCLVSYRFVNLKLFHPQQRNFDQDDTGFLNTGFINTGEFFFDAEI